MAFRTANEAFQQHIEPLREALQCITPERLTLRAKRRIEIDVPYSVTLSDLEPVPLKTAWVLSFAAGQILRIEAADAADPRGSFRVRTIRYVYRFLAAEELGPTEVLAFHWTPEATGGRPVTFPHLHIGSALLGGQTIIRPHDLHKAHVPTGLVSLQTVVRFAITEFGVTPLRPDWDEVLERTEEASSRWQIW